MEDLDLDLDNSDRVSQRIAHGVYRIIHNRKEVGEELWGIFGLHGGGFRIMTEIDLQWPIPNQQRARLDLDVTWHEQHLFVQLDAEGKRHRATYFLSEGGAEVNVFEEPLRYADVMQGNRGKAADQSFQHAGNAQAKRVFGDTLTYGDDTFFDFGSTLMNFVHLKRLNLKLNGQAAMRAIVAMQPSLEPLTIVQTYRYVRNEVISTVVQPAVNTRRYTIEEQSQANTNAGDSPTTTIWVDDHGIVLKQDVLLGKDTHACELVRYAWQGN